MTKPKTTRLIRRINELRQLQAEHGDVPFSKAITSLTEEIYRLQNPRPGRPQWWCNVSRVNIFLCVEAIKKARGIGTTAAWREVAKFYGHKVNVVQKAYSAGRKHFEAEPTWLNDEAVIFHRETAPPALKKFLQQKSNHRRK